MTGRKDGQFMGIEVCRYTHSERESLKTYGDDPHWSVVQFHEEWQISAEPVRFRPMSTNLWPTIYHVRVIRVIRRFDRSWATKL